MELSKTPYKNNSRVVSGTPILFPDDVVLLCDTTSAPVVINLLDIPANYWSTVYNLYVIDNGNNALVNNITINAGTGQLINSSPSVVISSNGGFLKISISANANYVAIPTSGGHIIQGNGVPVPQQPILNFTGSGVTVTDLGGKSVVNIAGSGVVSVTNAQLLALITAKTVVVGTTYLVTDAPASGGGVYVTGESINTVSVSGVGMFLNADFQKVGDYSGVPGFVSQLGIWTTIVQPVVVGNVVIRDLNHYVNITGVWGTDPTGDAVNWTLLAVSQTTGFILNADQIRYNVYANTIVYRADNKGNECEQSGLSTFQWGKDDVTFNKVIGITGQIDAKNSYAMFRGNIVYGALVDATTIIGGGYTENVITANANLNIASLSATSFLSNNNIEGTIQSLVEVVGNINSNTILVTSSILLFSVHAQVTINGNILSQGGSIVIGSTLVALSINNNRISNNVQVIFPLPAPLVDAGVYDGFVSESGFSNFELTVDMSDPLLYDVPTKTLLLPPNVFFFGRFKLINSTGKIIEKITNIPFVNEPVFFPQPTEDVTFQHKLIGVAVADELVCDAPGSANTLIGRIDGTDFIQYRQSGTLRERTNLVLLA